MTKEIFLRIRFYADKADTRIKTVITPDAIIHYGKTVNIPKNTQSIHVTIFEPRSE